MLVERRAAGSFVEEQQAAGLELLSHQLVDKFLDKCNQVIKYTNSLEAAEKFYTEREYLRDVEAFSGCGCHSAFGKDDDGQVRHDGLVCRKRR
jgi:hypothetical protein